MKIIMPSSKLYTFFNTFLSMVESVISSFSFLSGGDSLWTLVVDISFAVFLSIVVLFAFIFYFFGNHKTKENNNMQKWS